MNYQQKMTNQRKNYYQHKNLYFMLTFPHLVSHQSLLTNNFILHTANILFIYRNFNYFSARKQDSGEQKTMDISRIAIILLTQGIWVSMSHPIKLTFISGEKKMEDLFSMFIELCTWLCTQYPEYYFLLVVSFNF